MILLLLGHIVGDFYVQTSNMAQKKAKQVSWVLIHCLIYFFFSIRRQYSGYVF